MSAEQWAGMMRGDESYAGSPSFFRFEKVVQDIFGYRARPPDAPGARRASASCSSCSLRPGQGDPEQQPLRHDARQHRARAASRPLDLVIAEGRQPRIRHPFKGNLDLARLEALLRARGRRGRPAVHAHA